MLLFFQDFFYGQNIFLHGEADIVPGERQPVDALRASLIGGPGVVGQNADGGVPLVLREQGQKCGREADVQQEIPGGVRKAAGGVRVAVAVGNVGLDIENRGAVHQVRTAHMQNRAEFPGLLHAQKADAGQPQIVGAERGTGGEDPHPDVSAQPGRAHGGRPALPDSFGKLPDEPQMGKVLNAPQGVGIAEFRLEDDGGAEGFHQPALPGDAEFGGKVAVHPGNDLNIDRIHYALTFLKQKVTAKIAASPRLMAAPAEQPE